MEQITRCNKEVLIPVCAGSFTSRSPDELQSLGLSDVSDDQAASESIAGGNKDSGVSAPHKHPSAHLDVLTGPGQRRQVSRRSHSSPWLGLQCQRPGRPSLCSLSHGLFKAKQIPAPECHGKDAPPHRHQSVSRVPNHPFSFARAHKSILCSSRHTHPHSTSSVKPHGGAVRQQRQIYNPHPPPPPHVKRPATIY
uniref:Uncharacterized protein n=1 Tax=Knipowitschia caucasica TaxID=637954 RepID=A0AAV2JN47_KNICA